MTGPGVKAQLQPLTQDNLSLQTTLSTEHSAALTNQEILKRISKFYGTEMSLGSTSKEKDLAAAYLELTDVQKQSAETLKECFRSLNNADCSVMTSKSQFMTFLAILGADENQALALWEKSNSTGMADRQEALSEVASFISQALETHESMLHVCRHMQIINWKGAAIPVKLQAVVKKLNAITDTIKRLTKIEEGDFILPPPVGVEVFIAKNDGLPGNSAGVPTFQHIKEALRKEIGAEKGIKLVELGSDARTRQLMQEITYLENEIHTLRSKMKGSKASNWILGLRLSSIEVEAREKREQMEYHLSKRQWG